MARRIAFILFVLFAGTAFVAATFDPGVAVAETKSQKKKPPQKRQPGLFERLFGPRKVEPPAPVKSTTTTKKRTRPGGKSTEPPVAAVAVVAKDENARKILVIGDYVASGVAWGLDQALAKETKLAVVDRTNPGSGLVRADYYDWNEALLGILNAENPDVVVVALGNNDRQQWRDGNQRLPMRSEEWQRAYVQRVDGLVDTLRVYGRPFFWVNAPPVRNAATSADMAYLNDLYKPRVTGAGGHFVDVWNGFTNASGQYIATGPDIEGQVRALRTSDGVNFTRAGKLKLSYYVEREVRRQTGIGAGTVDLLASTTQTSTIEIGPDGKKRLVGPVISLSDPLPGATGQLAGDPAPMVYDISTGMVLDAPAAAAKPPEESSLYRLVVKGEALAGAAGRVDDFAWPPTQRETQTFIGPPLAPPGPSADAGRRDTIAAQKAILTPLSASDAEQPQ